MKICRNKCTKYNLFLKFANKHVSTATNQRGTMEVLMETMFSVVVGAEGYKEDSWRKNSGPCMEAGSYTSLQVLEDDEIGTHCLGGITGPFCFWGIYV
jgi:hypothetical protein